MKGTKVVLIITGIIQFLFLIFIFIGMSQLFSVMLDTNIIQLAQTMDYNELQMFIMQNVSESQLMTVGFAFIGIIIFFFAALIMDIVSVVLSAKLPAATPGRVLGLVASILCLVFSLLTIFTAGVLALVAIPVFFVAGILLIVAGAKVKPLDYPTVY